MQQQLKQHGLERISFRSSQVHFEGSSHYSFAKFASNGVPGLMGYESKSAVMNASVQSVSHPSRTQMLTLHLGVAAQVWSILSWNPQSSSFMSSGCSSSFSRKGKRNLHLGVLLPVFRTTTFMVDFRKAKVTCLQFWCLLTKCTMLKVGLCIWM